MATFDFLSAGAIIAVIGIAIGLTFSIFKEKRERRIERERQEERMKAQRESFAKEVKETVQNQANDLKERLDDKLEIIRVSTSGLQKNFEEFKTINKDEVLSIKRDLERLYDEYDKIKQKGGESTFELERVKNDLDAVKERLSKLEARVSNHDGISSTR